MESTTPSFRNRNLSFLQSTPEDSDQYSHSALNSPISLPASSSLSRFNSNPPKKNKLLDRIRTQLTNIKSQVFKMTKSKNYSNDHTNSPSRSTDSNKRDKSIDRQSGVTRLDIRVPTEPNECDRTYHQFQNQQLRKDCQLLREKLEQKQLKYRDERVTLSNRVTDLEYQLMEKQRRLEEYESDLQQEIQRFKEDIRCHNDSEGLRKRVFYLENVLEDTNNELMYLKKRTSDDAAEIRKYTIENYELKKQCDYLGKQDSAEEDLNRLNETIRQLQGEVEWYKSEGAKESIRVKGVDVVREGDESQVARLREKIKSITEQFGLQQNTIEVLEFELSKALKQNKRIEIRNQQDLKNAKITYENLLESVKEGLTECYKSEIEDLRVQLSRFQSGSNSERVFEESIDIHIGERQHLPPPPSRTQHKVVTEISSQIIIVEEDQSLESTQRKNTTPENELDSPRQQLKRRVQYLQGVIQGLQKQIYQFKWVKQGTITPHADTREQIQAEECVQFLELKTQRLAGIIERVEKERDSYMYELIIKQNTAELVSEVVGKVIEEEIMNKECVNSINSEMQFVIEKLKMRNYEAEKKSQELERGNQSLNRTIQELRHQIQQMEIKSQEENEINKLIINKVHSLQEQNIKLHNEKDLDKQKSESKLQELHQYKSALETEITKRESKISHLKDEISSIVGEHSKKKNSSKVSGDENQREKEKERGRIRGESEVIKMQANQIESLQLIIKDLSQQLNQAKTQHTRKKTNESLREQNNEVKQLKADLMKKNEEIYQYKNQNAVTRLRCDSLKSDQDIERVGWMTEKKNLEIRLERQIQNLLRDLSLEKQTVQFLSSHIKSLESQLTQKDEIINKMFCRQKQDTQNTPSIQKRAKLQSLSKQKSRSFMARKLSQSYKAVTNAKQPREIPKLTQLSSFDLNT